MQNNDFTVANHTRFDLLNLQVVVFQIVRNRALTEILSVLVFLGLLARWIFRLRWKADAGLYDLAVLAVIFLLPFYYRFYDSSLLLLPLAWALTQVTTGLRTFARAVLILAMPFMLPGAALLQQGQIEIYPFTCFPKVGGGNYWLRRIRFGSSC